VLLVLVLGLPRRQLLRERQHQPHVPHHQLADGPRHVPVDQLDVVARVEPLVVRRHQRDHPVLDEYVPVAAGLRVNMLDA
jgi:hypothetical protein